MTQEIVQSPWDYWIKAGHGIEPKDFAHAIETIRRLRAQIAARDEALAAKEVLIDELYYKIEMLTTALEEDDG